jgi:hypothetical protein
VRDHLYVSQDLNRVQGSLEAIDKMRSRGLKKEQLEEYAVCEKLISWLQVGASAGKLARVKVAISTKCVCHSIHRMCMPQYTRNVYATVHATVYTECACH